VEAARFEERAFFAAIAARGRARCSSGGRRSSCSACAVNTVELHVTEILRRARCGNRAELVAAFWRSP
jgi:hypothetical protein